jgi:acyl homoserine lactone synthase
MFRDRHAQFVNRHRWDLTLQEDGLEKDEFDDDATKYCIFAEASAHLASIRLRGESDGSMVERHFSSLWHRTHRRLRHSHEVTRFCTAPRLSARERRKAVAWVLLELCRHCIRCDIDRFFGVVYPGVHRSISRYGWHGVVVAEDADASGRCILLCEWQADESVAWKIQESSACGNAEKNGLPFARAA